MKIITNNQPRPILRWWNLTDKEKAEFDWLDTEEQHSGEFFRYKGQVYCLDEFTCTSSDGEFADWCGLHSTSAFSGVLVKFIPDIDDEIVVGFCYS